MKSLLLYLLLSSAGTIPPVVTLAQSPSPAGASLILFGRGMYPGDAAGFEQVKASGFTTFILSGF